MNDAARALTFVPSSQQEAIFNFIRSGTGHGLVVARAGTGKTTTIQHALECVPAGASVLCCAFNARIRDVLLERVPRHIRVRTLHQLGRDTLADFRQYRVFKHDEDDTKAKEIARAVLHDTVYENEAFEGEDGPAKHAARARYNELVDSIERGMRLVKATLTTARPDLLALIKEHDLNTTLDEDNELAEFIANGVRMSVAMWPRTDFDDEVWLPVFYGLGLRRYDYVFVDEAQDLTLTQIRLALSAVTHTGRVIAVGDPAQAIYRWRGADRDPFARLQQELGAQTFPLSVSYRCPQKVINLARRYVPDIEAHPTAPEGAVQAIDIEDMLELVVPGDYVLSRTNAPLAKIGLELNVSGTPTKVVGSSDVGTMLANLVRRSRKRTVLVLNEWLDTYLAKERERLKDRAGALAYAEDKVQTIRSFTEGETEVSAVITKIERFFAEQQRSRGRTVVLSTVHRLKGDEADRVFLLEETFFNQRGDPTEEKNIHYVAVTRAKRKLFLVTGLYKRRKDA